METKITKQFFALFTKEEIEQLIHEKALAEIRKIGENIVFDKIEFTWGHGTDGIVRNCSISFTKDEA
jgi:hypothetical protein